MATINSFEDLEIWQKAQELGAFSYGLSEKNSRINQDLSFRDQLKRAALSISNNTAEGFEYNNNNDFYRYPRIAKGSCGELRNCLLFAVRIRYCFFDEVSALIGFSKSLSNQIGAMMKYLKQRQLQSSKETRNS